jgi:probable F420-dependent oxidoreductase
VTSDAVGVEFGLTVFSTDRSVRPDEVAQAAEANGFDLLYFPDHTHVPVHQGSRWPGAGRMPDAYARIFDPLIATAAALSVTSRIRVGPGVCLVAQRDPIVLAKQVASIDVLYGGRVLFGVGAGWSAEEASNHGLEPGERWAVMGEHVAAIRRIWTAEIASFDGDHLSITEMRSWPKPMQRSGPAILVGGDGPGVFGRILEYGDGWYASPRPGLPPLTERIAELRRRAAERGRPRPIVHVQVFGEAPAAKVIDKYRAAGVDGIVLEVPSVDRAAALRRIEAHAHLVRAIG